MAIKVHKKNQQTHRLINKRVRCDKEKLLTISRQAIVVVNRLQTESRSGSGICKFGGCERKDICLCDHFWVVIRYINCQISIRTYALRILQYIFE